jgi:hypothetical protein
MRVPLALRLSREMRARLLRRATSEGIAPRSSVFARWVGSLIVEAIPGAVADALRAERLEETVTHRAEAGPTASPIPLAPGNFTTPREKDGSDGAC